MPRLLVFLHGTAIMHAGGVGHSRAERVEQVRRGEASVREFASYVPIGGAAAKLRRWRERGAQIAYLSSHRDPAGMAADAAVLDRHGFPPGRLLARRPGETYGDVVARERPDALVEDDCESIGSAELAHPQLPPELQARIVSVVVPEFGGIDHLPDSPGRLLEPSAG